MGQLLSYIGTLKYSTIQFRHLKTPSVVAKACSCNYTVHEYFSNLGFLAWMIQRSDSALFHVTREFHSVKLICRNMLYFQMWKRKQ